MDNISKKEKCQITRSVESIKSKGKKLREALNTRTNYRVQETKRIERELKRTEMDRDSDFKHRETVNCKSLKINR